MKAFKLRESEAELISEQRPGKRAKSYLFPVEILLERSMGI